MEKGSNLYSKLDKAKPQGIPEIIHLGIRHTVDLEALRQKFESEKEEAVMVTDVPNIIQDLELRD